MAEIEIGLGAVVGDEDLAVLERAHRAGIDVDVRVHLEQRHLEAARLEQRADRRRRQPLAQRRDHAAGDEDELGLVVAIHCQALPGFSRPAAVRARARAEVLGCIYFKRWRHGSDHPNTIAVLQRAQLFELFERLEHARRQARRSAAGNRADRRTRRYGGAPRRAARRPRAANGIGRARNTARRHARRIPPSPRWDCAIRRASDDRRRQRRHRACPASARIGAASASRSAGIDERQIALHVEIDLRPRTLAATSAIRSVPL